MIKTTPIASYRIDIYTKQHLREWFKTEYALALAAIGVYYRTNIYNINKKGAWIYMPVREEVVILIRVIEIYIRIPKN